jgi:FAD/FMN-containing dehydrogenase
MAEKGTISIPELRAAVTGKVFGPDDAEYDPARTPYYGGLDWRPAVIVQVADADDVARVIALARDTGLPLAVRNGGHSVHSGCDDGILLDLSGMKDLQVDVGGRTAWAEAGLTAGEFSTAVAAHGLATGFGDSAMVGIGGATLGGGIGYLVRKHGLTIDQLLAAELVTADGSLLRVDEDHEPDLFWAIRGGGGNFGVVTRLRFRLHEVGTVLGGLLVLPATPEAIVAFVEQARLAPEELSTIVNIMTAPPMPFLPEEHHGKTVMMAMLVYVGVDEAAERTIASFRAIAEPIVDMVAPVPYPDVLEPDEPGFHPLAASRNLFVDDVDLDRATSMLERIDASTAWVSAVQLRVLGGAMARVPVDATAFAHRGRGVMVNLAALYENPDETDRHQEWVSDFLLAMQQGVELGVYTNFLAEDSAARIREAYPGATWDRLTAVKRRYDPTNLFRANNNIPPAGDDG